MTISSVVPMIALLNNSILKNCDDNMKLTASLKQAVKDDMNSRYNNGSEASQLLCQCQVPPFFPAHGKCTYNFPANYNCTSTPAMVGRLSNC